MKNIWRNTMNKRDLIRDLINSLAHDEPMRKVMMMAQAVSFELYNFINL